ncbi:MAG: rhodanese-related sulfurtransferase [Alphaproteobacteria bacterium]
MQPFGKAKVRLKKETISLGEEVRREHVGEYVEPKDWNALISDPDTVILDTRNAYEYKLGTFRNAIDPDTRTFKELPEFVRKNLADKKDKPIATFCTGGIRCEKLTAWLKQEGFEKVYHLRGGILQYLEDVPEEHSLWQGECFVFDERVAVDHSLSPSVQHTMCPGCGLPVTPEDKLRDDYVEGKSCRFCVIK